MPPGRRFVELARPQARASPAGNEGRTGERSGVIRLSCSPGNKPEVREQSSTRVANKSWIPGVVARVWLWLFSRILSRVPYKLGLVSPAPIEEEKQSMRLVKLVMLIVFAIALISPFAWTRSAEGQAATEAPRDYDAFNSNGFTDQATFLGDQAEFDQVEGTGEGLGPTYNAQSCRECHQNPISGGISQITELRCGHQDGAGNFVNPTIFIDDGNASIPNRSLVNDRAICPGIVTDANGGQHDFLQRNIQERVPGSENIRTFRTSLNLLGDGFVEAINSNTLVAIANNEVAQSGGRINPLVIQVPVLEAPGNNRVGRFGWKNQMASLLSFSGDAYINEMGISNQIGR